MGVKKGTLYLIPTPISGLGELHQKTFHLLKTEFLGGSTIAVEEARAGRRRWISWGLPKDAVDSFELYNEHTREEKLPIFKEKLLAGVNICLLSDCGLPSFCDPGVRLVDMAHGQGIRVTSAPFDNSVILALALSGFSHDRFWFGGFLPKEKGQRAAFFDKIGRKNETCLIMDTAYRLEKVLTEISRHPKGRHWACFLGADLNKDDEFCKRGNASSLLKRVKGEKKEFVLVISPNYGKKPL